MKNIWMQTYTGRKVYPFEFGMEDYDLTDVAHALSMICRFNGHCTQFYSVAEHCLRVSDMLPDHLKLQGLLHDAAEAYLGDVITGVKGVTDLDGASFKVREDAISHTIAVFYGLEWPFDEEVKHADNVILATEARDIVAPCETLWAAELPEPLLKKIEPMDQGRAKAEYMMVVTAEQITRKNGVRCDFYK